MIVGWLLAGAGGSLLAGCAVGPDFERPAAPSQERYDAVQVVLPTAGAGQPQQRLQPGAEPADRWWHAFGSPLLDGTVGQALDGSPTLAAAHATLAAALEATVAARGALLPQVDLAAMAGRGNQIAVRSGGVGTGNLYSLGLSAGYVADVFGGTRRGIEQQAALADVERSQVAAAYLELTGSVVAGAINVAGAQA
ncbi:MAG: TolC family protein, partial [Proteobacteria bacterium]|nr:TolC family protein [Pseudomonadota bacterium]